MLNIFSKPGLIRVSRLVKKSILKSVILYMVNDRRKYYWWAVLGLTRITDKGRWKNFIVENQGYNTDILGKDSKDITIIS